MGEMRVVPTGPDNPNWRGGRSIASNGYVLIKVGKDHHLADVRGYAYEHRLVAEKKLDRRLLPGEIPHHIDGNRQNNCPDNIEVTASRAHHHLRHRGPNGDRLRLPDEPNREILCGCGCSRALLMFDGSGRPRRYAQGHNPQAETTLAALERAVLTGCTTTAELSLKCGISRQAVGTATSKLVAAGRIARRWVGIFGPPGSPPLRQQETITCACCCGTAFDRYDSSGRERRYIRGHYRRKAA